MTTLESVLDQIQTDNASLELGPDTDLFDAGVLDSLRLMALVGWVEDTHQTEIDPMDIVFENFGTPRAIAALIDRLVVD